MAKNKVIAHLKGDIKTFKKEASDDRVLIKSLKIKKPKKYPKIINSKKIEKVMNEFGAGELHSGSINGPKVTKRKQAIAIALSEARRGKKK